MKLRRILEKVEAASGFTSEEKGRRLEIHCRIHCGKPLETKEIRQY